MIGAIPENENPFVACQHGAKSVARWAYCSMRCSRRNDTPLGEPTPGQQPKQKTLVRHPPGRPRWKGPLNHFIASRGEIDRFRNWSHVNYHGWSLPPMMDLCQSAIDKKLWRQVARKGVRDAFTLTLVPLHIDRHPTFTTRYYVWRASCALDLTELYLLIEAHDGLSGAIAERAGFRGLALRPVDLMLMIRTGRPGRRSVDNPSNASSIRRGWKVWSMAEVASAISITRACSRASRVKAVCRCRLGRPRVPKMNWLVVTNTLSPTPIVLRPVPRRADSSRQD